MKRFIFCCGVLLSIPLLSLRAQIDTLRVGQVLDNLQYLKPSVSKFMMYSEKGGKHTPVDAVWIRKVEFEKMNGVDMIHLRQQIDSKDTTQRIVKSSILQKNTLAPVNEIAENDFFKMVTSFSGTSATVSLDSIKTGIHRKLDVDLKIAGYDFEADEELFSLLPFKENYKVAIPFYQPGTGRATRYYVYEVAGSESIELPDGGKIECWKIQSQYTGGLSTWWFSKKNQQVIKQTRQRSDGGISYKVRLITVS